MESYHLLEYNPRKMKEKSSNLSLFRILFVSLPYSIKVFCKDTTFLQKDKAQACESLGFVVNKTENFLKEQDKSLQVGVFCEKGCVMDL